MLKVCVLLLLLNTKVVVGKNKSGRFSEFNFQQNDYKYEFERLEVVRFNKDYVTNFHIVTFKYNRTVTAINASFIYNANLDSNLKVTVQAYRFASNEYREFPIRFQFDYCDSMAKNNFGSGTWKCGNFTGCPIVKGRHSYVCNWSPDASRLPPFIPNGKYMTELEVSYFSKEVLVMRDYSEVSRPFNQK